MKAILTILFLSFGLCKLAFPASGCTIVSALSSDGQVWNMNNEDGPSGVANFINVFPKSGENTFGYFTLSYLSPQWGTGGMIQGGMNEAGLTYDFNSIDQVDFDFSTRKNYPDGDHAILPYILGNLSSVDQVIDFFNTYWFQGGFTSAQMHVADKKGNFAIISASGVYRAKSGQPLVSTNFDICSNQDGSSCWRYPVADSIVNKQEASFETMLEISQQTRQGEGTLYTNIQNLTTGDIWFMSKHDPGVMEKINIRELLKKGRESFTFCDLQALKKEHKPYRWQKRDKIEIANTHVEKFLGSYSNPMIGEIQVTGKHDNIELVFANKQTAVFYAIGEQEFQIDETEDVWLRFNDNHEMAFYENGFWSFTARKK